MELKRIPNSATKSPYIAWLCCLYAIVDRGRKEGLLSHEEDANNPLSKESVFSQFQLTLSAPYLDLAASLLRVLSDGFHEDYIDLFGEQALHGFRLSKSKSLVNQFFNWFKGNVIDESIVRMIIITFQLSSRGDHAEDICELIRQLIPYKHRPNLNEWGGILKDLQECMNIKTSNWHNI